VAFCQSAYEEAYGVESMPETSDKRGRGFRVSRADQDAFAYRSQVRAKRAQAAGRFAEEIVPVKIAGRRRNRHRRRRRAPAP